MIPEAAITEWGRTVPWPTVEQIEQDLLLSRLIIEIANDDYLGDELVFRGDTCLHKLHAPHPLRYSEDLDYVRSTGGGIRELARAVSQIGRRLGMDVRTRLTEHPKMFLRASYEAGAGPMRVFHRFRFSSSTCIRAQNDSTIALSKQSPIDPIDGRSPDSCALRVNTHDVNCSGSRGRSNTLLLSRL